MQLIVGDEHERSQHANEQASGSPAGRNRQVKSREVLRSGLEHHELAMTDRAQAEQGRKIADNLPDERRTVGTLDEQDAGERQCYFGGKYVDSPRIPAFTVEADDKRHEIQGQRSDPQEWYDGHVEADLIRGGQQHDRRNHRQTKPQADQVPPGLVGMRRMVVWKLIRLLTRRGFAELRPWSSRCVAKLSDPGAISHDHCDSRTQ